MFFLDIMDLNHDLFVYGPHINFLLTSQKIQAP